MYLMGHTDPTLTLAVYQQVLDMGKGSVGLLEQTLGCTLPEARAIYNGEATAAEILGASRNRPRSGLAGRSIQGSGAKNGRAARQVSGTNPEPGDPNASSVASEPDDQPTRKTRSERGFRRAAEGTRTLDLLHGKQTL